MIKNFNLQDSHQKYTSGHGKVKLLCPMLTLFSQLLKIQFSQAQFLLLGSLFDLFLVISPLFLTKRVAGKKIRAASIVLTSSTILKPIAKQNYSLWTVQFSYLSASESLEISSLSRLLSLDLFRLSPSPSLCAYTKQSPQIRYIH